MTTHTKPKHELWLLGLCLMIVALSSCTYDYFVDENNFRIYVPQIERGEITNFHIAFHDASGKHVLTRQISAPFNKNELMMQGILRFKLPYGDGYRISCFADYHEDAMIPGQPFDNSYLKKSQIEGTSTYLSRTTNPRAYLSSASVFPIGHPQAFETKTIDIDEDQRYKGKVEVNFKDLPAFVSRIEIYYLGLATKYCFDGTFSRFTPDDRILVSFNRNEYDMGNMVTYTDIVNPSVGVSPFGIMPPLLSDTPSPISDPLGEPLELEIRMFDDQNTSVGVVPFTNADFVRLQTEDPTKVPTAEDGTPLTHLVLEPQKTIVFTLSGFTIVSITIQGWGDIIGGGATPM